LVQGDGHTNLIGSLIPGPNTSVYTRPSTHSTDSNFCGLLASIIDIPSLTLKHGLQVQI
jgi:hypothetical protein